MMKNNIEDLIKKALEGQELPYQEGAWESFQKKMDAKEAPKSYKWWIAGAASIIAVIATLALWNKEDNNSTTSSKTTENKSNYETNENGENIKINAKTSSNNKSVANFKNEVISNNTNSDVVENNSATISDVLSDVAVNSTVLKSKSKEIIQTKQEPSKVTISKDEITQLPQVNGLKEPNFPAFGNKCKGESIQIDNNGNYSIVLKSPSGKINEIENNSKSEVILKEIGVYHIGFYDPASHGNFKETSNFRVNNSPTINLNVDDVLTYENGLPTIKAEVITSEENVFWKIENERKSAFQNKPKSTELYFFSKGNYNVVVKASNEFGCESKESKSVFISEDYNLLAVNAFNPNSSEIRNNTFIPYALKVRNTPFRMVILDPDNGGVVFESTDASNAWDGIDRKDGKMVPAQKAYIWKVSLSNPEQGEKSEYKGTIVRVL